MWKEVFESDGSAFQIPDGAYLRYSFWDGGWYGCRPPRADGSDKNSVCVASVRRACWACRVRGNGRILTACDGFGEACHRFSVSEPGSSQTVGTNTTVLSLFYWADLNDPQRNAKATEGGM